MRRAAPRLALGLLLLVLLPACGVGGTSATLSPNVSPQAPTGLTARSGNGQVTLSWDFSAAAGSYDVLRSASSGGPYAPVPAGQGVTGATFVDTNLVNGQTVYYVVRAVNRFGMSPDSSEIPGTAGFATSMIAAGNTHSLAVLTDGSLWGWGANNQGQLGAGSSRAFSNVALPADLDHVVALSAGTFHSLALRADHSLWAWGGNLNGLITPDLVSQSNVPLPVQGLGSVAAASAGYGHNLALIDDGTVWAWGSNLFGQIDGVASPADQRTPIQVPGLPPGIVAVSAGRTHSLALDGGGNVWAWGDNTHGILGNGTLTLGSLPPAPVANLREVVAIAAGEEHSLAVLADGTVWAWGWNTYGKLGIGVSSYEEHPFPERVAPLTGVVAASVGVDFSAALRSDGTVWAWGRNNRGQLGRTTPVASYVPLAVPELGSIREISAGGSFMLARAKDGTTWAWGESADGQLGGGTGAIQDVPVRVSNLTSVAQASTGMQFAVAVRADGTLWSWGSNANGQLGIGSTVDSPFRLPVPFASGTVTAVAAGSAHAVAALSDGTLWGWGQTNGNGSSSQLASPTSFAGPAGVTALAAGSGFTLALNGATGQVWFWGDNMDGQKGDGTSGGVVLPPVQTGLTGVSAIAAGSKHCLALSGGTVQAWGDNRMYQCGTPALTVWSPVQVVGLTGVTSVSAGEFHSVAVLGGTVMAWGHNAWNQLGPGTSVLRTETPVEVTGLPAIAAVAAGSAHTVALAVDGTVWGWGANQLSQLGTSAFVSTASPIQIPLPLPAVSVSAGAYFSAARLSDGSLWAWGYNASGQIGIGTGGMSATPLRVTR